MLSNPAGSRHILMPAFSMLSDMLRVLQVSPDDEGLSSEPECEIYCYSWWRQAPAPDTPSRQEAGAGTSAHMP